MTRSGFRCKTRLLTRFSSYAVINSIWVSAVLLFTGCAGDMGSSAGRSVSTTRLYVFDCSTLHIPDPVRFGFTKAELGNSDLAVTCVLVAHPKGLLMWDVGAMPDRAFRHSMSIKSNRAHRGRRSSASCGKQAPCFGSSTIPRKTPSSRKHRLITIDACVIVSPIVRDSVRVNRDVA